MHVPDQLHLGGLSKLFLEKLMSLHVMLGGEGSQAMTLQNCSGHNIVQRLAIGESYTKIQ